MWKPHDIHSGFIGNLGEVLVGDFHQLVCGSPQGAPFLQSPPVGRVGLGHLVVEVLPRRFPETLRLLFVMYLASDPLVQRARVEQEAQAFLGDEVHHVVEVWSCRTIPPRWWSRSFSPVGLFASVAEPLRTRCPWSSLRVVYKLGRSSHAPFCIPGYIVLPRGPVCHRRCGVPPRRSPGVPQRSSMILPPTGGPPPKGAAVRGRMERKNPGAS